ncbi:MAG: hypothetical protein IPJ28_00765 [Betaproteobacteria bacterium]|nr:hypothetical protein [Betaproteobacteria bacterium]
MRIATLTLAAALAAPAAGLASEAPLPGPAAGWGMSEAWRESIARSLGALRAESANGVPRLSADLPDSFDDERRVRVRASASFSPRIAMSLPAWVAADGGAGIDLSAQARRPRAGQHANGIADRTLWSTSAEGWHDAGPFTAYAGAGTGRSSDTFDPGRLERNAYAGLELDGLGGVWRLESGWVRGDPIFGTEREMRLAWRGAIARGWSLGLEASLVTAPGWIDRAAFVSLRGKL